MHTLYFSLAAVHILAVVVTGILWTIVDLVPKTNLRLHLRDIRAVHFGSIYLVAWFLGLAYAFDRLQVPDFHWSRIPQMTFFSPARDLRQAPEKQGCSANSCHAHRGTQWVTAELTICESVLTVA